MIEIEVVVAGHHDRMVNTGVRDADPTLDVGVLIIQRRKFFQIARRQLGKLLLVRLFVIKADGLVVYDIRLNMCIEVVGNIDRRADQGQQCYHKNDLPYNLGRRISLPREEISYKSLIPRKLRLGFNRRNLLLGFGLIHINRLGCQISGNTGCNRDLGQV